MFILLCFACSALAEEAPGEDTAAGQLTDQMSEIRERLEQLAEEDALEVVEDETAPTDEAEAETEDNLEDETAVVAG
jgi:hypothetical protein